MPLFCPAAWPPPSHLLFILFPLFFFFLEVVAFCEPPCAAEWTVTWWMQQTCHTCLNGWERTAEFPLCRFAHDWNPLRIQNNLLFHHCLLIETRHMNNLSASYRCYSFILCHVIRLQPSFANEETGKFSPHQHFDKITKWMWRFRIRV